MSKPKPVNWTLANDQDIDDIIETLLDRYHRTDKSDSIGTVHCVPMWRHNIKIDQDNYILLADISKSTDKVRELYPHDMIIGINKDAWSILEENQKFALIDAQLERIAVCLDKDDETKEDDKARTVYRLRRPEVMDEHTIQRRHGTTIQEIQEYVLDKFSGVEAEEGSYVDNALNDKDDNEEQPADSTTTDDEPANSIVDQE